VVVKVARVGWSFGGDLGDGDACGGFVDDGLVGGERGDQCLEGEVVDRAGVAAAGLVDQVVASSENRVSLRPARVRWWRR
jgi:hypothetical protein